MKLEALNGNILPVVKAQQEQTSAAESHGAIDDEELPEVIGEEESADGKKKKQTRKKRSLNWEEAERVLLLEVVKPKVDYVEIRTVDAKSIKAKRLAWLQITKQFNALNFRHRSLEQIQVQWRSMKNTAKREHQNKNQKPGALEGMELLDFMEEMQKEPVSTRSQTRAPSNVTALVIKKEEIEEQDIDEDMPLAALPTANDDSSLQTQTGVAVEALLSPPPFAELLNESQHVSPVRNSNNKKKVSAQKPQQVQHVQPASKPKRQRSQNSMQSLDLVMTPTTTMHAAPANGADEPYKKDIFELIKRSRLAEMDYMRREHEQKLRMQQIEQELKLSYYRKQEELKLQHLREEHETRMKHTKLEHEARMKAYASKTGGRSSSKPDAIQNLTNSQLPVATANN